MKKFIFIFIPFFLFASIKDSYLKSYDYEKVGRYNDAIRVLIPLIKKYPKGYTLNLRFGWLFYLNKNYNNSIKYYKQALILAPYSFEAKLGLIRVYLNTYNYKKVETLSYEIIKKDYYNYYANIYLIKSLIAQKKYKVALENISKMLTIYPTNTKFLELLAIIYKNTQDKRLNKLLDDILILDPNNITAKLLKNKD